VNDYFFFLAAFLAGFFAAAFFVAMSMSPPFDCKMVIVSVCDIAEFAPRVKCSRHDSTRSVKIWIPQFSGTLISGDSECGSVSWATLPDDQRISDKLHVYTR
jgi:hypothetical protein